MHNENELNQLAKKIWTTERLKKITAHKKLFLNPHDDAWFLFNLGLMNKDASMSVSQVSKFLQINHMLNLLDGLVKSAITQFRQINILDCGCGSSYLTFLLAWRLKRENHPFRIVGIDTNQKVISKCQEKAISLGFAEQMSFFNQSISSFNWNSISTEAMSDDAKIRRAARPHLVVALHACDTATDQALATAVRLESDFIAVAPCCQAELAHKWSTLPNESANDPLAPLFQTPHFRREAGALFTDVMRMLLLRSRGYEVTATEFIAVEHTPKNRLLLCTRRGRFLESARLEYLRFKAASGEQGIALEGFLDEKTTEEASNPA